MSEAFPAAAGIHSSTANRCELPSSNAASATQSLPALGGRPPLAGQALEDEIAKLLPPHERTCWMCSEGDPINAIGVPCWSPSSSVWDMR